ncbi:MAG: hypothetical protein PHY46_05225 [Candidatus Omnitrophica bacterium]|nr:hypothetical protein [Candidatus Omnitrophota bacterium]
MENGDKTGKIQNIGQSKEELEKELLDSVTSGRDDLRTFVDSVVGR